MTDRMSLRKLFLFDPVPSEGFGFSGYFVDRVEIEDDDTCNLNHIWVGNKRNILLWHTFFPTGTVFVACEN